MLGVQPVIFHNDYVKSVKYNMFTQCFNHGYMKSIKYDNKHEL